jgi:phospholipase C
MRPRSPPGLGTAVVMVVLMASVAWQLPAPANAAADRSGATLNTLAEFNQHIKHIVVVVLENHAFDNYFGTYCRTVGPYCPAAVDGVPWGTCVPFNPANRWNNGLMNGFYPAERSGLTPMGHYGARTIPLYWDLAEQYGLADHFFSTAQSYSLPNHWDLLA